MEKIFYETQRIFMVIFIIILILFMFSQKAEAALGAAFKFRLKEDNITLNVKDVQTLEPRRGLASVKVKDIKWSSSNKEVITVSVGGKVTAKKPGTAIITATTKVGNEKATCKIIVKQPPTGVKLNKSSITLKAGTNQKLKATLSPSNATNKNVKWSSSDPSIATVDKNGKVIAKQQGDAKITVTTLDGNKKATCTIKVEQPVTGVSLDTRSITLNIGSSLTLKPTVKPPNATNKNVTWSSTNTKVATVSNGTVTAKAEGTTTIKVTTEDGGHSDVCKVTVKKSKSILGPTATMMKTTAEKLKENTIEKTNTKMDGVYKYAVPKKEVDTLMKIIKSKKLYQEGNRGELENKCDEVANYHIYLLLGIKTANGKKVELNNSSVENLITIGDNEGTRKQYSSDKEFFKALKNNIDNGKPTRVHVNMEGGGNAGHWVTAIGYKGNGEKLTDFKFIGTYYYGLFDGGSKEVLSLYDYTLIVFN